MATSGADSIVGTAANDTIRGEGGNDTLDGAAGRDSLDGGSGHDDLIGGSGNDTLLGGTGNDRLYAPSAGQDAGDDSLVGGAGDDVLFDSQGSNTLVGGAGNDTFEVLVDASAATVASGGDGRDRYEIFHTSGERGAYTVTDFAPGAGGDLIDVMRLLTESAQASEPGPFFTGGNPFDQGFLRLVPDGSATHTHLQWDFDGAGDDFTWVTVLTLQNLDPDQLTADNFVKGISPDGSPVASDSITGSGTAETLAGGFFDDTIAGLGGHDLLEGGGGDDSLDGGEGNDFLLGGAGDDQASGGPGDDDFAGDSTSGAGDDTLSGGEGNDSFSDHVGANVLDGGPGDDFFLTGLLPGATSHATGGSGEDTYLLRGWFDGFSVADLAVGAEERDLLDLTEILNDSAFAGHYPGGNPFDPSNPFLALEQAGAHALLKGDEDGATGGSTWTTLVTLENVDVDDVTSANFVGGFNPDGSPTPGESYTGDELANERSGDFFDDTLAGGGGADTLDGLPGHDSIDGGEGDDFLVGGVGNDLLVGGAGHDNLASGIIGWFTGDDTILGGEGNDKLADFRGNNVLDGGSGDDVFGVRIDSSGGGTTLATGGDGEDVYFVAWDGFGSGGFTVTDFDPAADRISVTHLLLGSLVGDGSFTSGNPFDAELGFLRLTQDGADVLLEWDRDGAAGPLEWETLLRLESLDVPDLGAETFTDEIAENGLDPEGGAVAGSSITGSAGADSLEGVFFNDTLVGLAGDDTLIGGGGDDSIDGGDGNDVFDVLADSASAAVGDDTLVGGAGDDRFLDSFGDNVFDGGDGADRFVVSALDGAHSVATGGAGRDVYVLHMPEPASGYTVTDFAAGADGDLLDAWAQLLDASALDGAYSGGDPFAPEIAVLRLVQDGADTRLEWDRDGPAESVYDWQTVVTLQNLDADALSSDSFVGRLIVGSANDDALLGDFGHDTLQGLDGDDEIDGGVGDDEIDGGDGDNVVLGSAGTDVAVLPDAPADYVISILSTASGESVNLAREGRLDRLAGVERVRFLGDPETGADDVELELTPAGLLADVPVFFGQNYLADIDGAGTLDGGAGNDVLHGLEGSDKLKGRAGNDTLDGQAGDDTLIGGKGSDRYVVDSAFDSIVEATDAGKADRVETTLAVYSLAALPGVEQLRALSDEDFHGTGNALANLLIGAAGDDTLKGGGGNDVMQGGAGNDTYVVNAKGDVVIESGGDSGDTLQINRSVNLNSAFAEIEHVRLTGSAELKATGDAGDNRLQGNAAANTLDGGAGDDTLEGGAGSDRYIVDSTDDVVLETLVGGGTDKVLTSVDFDLTGTQIEHATLLDGGADELTGNALANRLTGGANNDTLDGGAGRDTLKGGAGDDRYLLDRTSDVVTEAADAGTDTVLLALSAPGSYTLAANVEHLELGGGADVNATGNGLGNRMTGNDGNDSLKGGGGDDTLEGGAGNDTLRGGAGADALEGGAGDDRFQLDSLTGVDSIAQFEAGDVLALNNAAFAKIGADGGLAATAFLAGAGVTEGADASHRVVFDSTGGGLYYDADGAGGAASVKIAQLEDFVSVSAEDILVV